VNRAGERIHGLYVDVNVGDATPLGDDMADAFYYQTGYDSGQLTCFPNGSPMTSDADLLYGGCVDRVGGGADAYVPIVAP
jgi:hypothetical protein